MKLFTMLGAAILMGTTLQASADEVWNSNTGQVVYEAEMGPTAVWTYGTPQSPGVIYLPGLAKVYSNRGSYRGYWAKDKAQEACDTARPGILGRMTHYWGHFDVTFIDKDFPARWEARWSYCDGEYEELKVEAKPLLGSTNPPAAQQAPEK